MSKSKKNVIDPESIIGVYGADTARLFMLSDSPPDRDLEWTDAGIEGAWRFVNRLWRLVTESHLNGFDQASPVETDPATHSLLQQCHRTIARVSEDLDRFAFNRTVARLREFVNFLVESEKEAGTDGSVRRFALETLVKLCGPIMPHIAEELWSRLGHRTLLADETWPDADPAFVHEERITIAVQVNGKLRGTIEVATDTTEAETRASALALPNVAKAMAGKAPRSVIVIRNRIVNVVV